MMTAEALEQALCSRFCAAIRVNPVPCGFAVSSPFTDASGDPIGFYVVIHNEGYHLEDDGDYLSRLVALGIDIEKGQRQQLLESILHIAHAFWDSETYEIKTSLIEEESMLLSQMVTFLSALIRVRDLELVTREFIRSTFREDVTLALRQRFNAVANIEERQPITPEFSEYMPDFVIRPKQAGRQTAIFLANNIVSFQEAELLKAEVEKEKRQDDIAVVALIENTDKINTINHRRFQRAQNRGLIMPIFHGDEKAALDAIARQALPDGFLSFPVVP